jgi:hypothetical protein
MPAVVRHGGGVALDPHLRSTSYERGVESKLLLPEAAIAAALRHFRQLLCSMDHQGLKHMF